MTNNPFQNPEPLQELFEESHNYAVTRDNALSAFKHQYRPQVKPTKPTNLLTSMHSKLTRLTTTTLASLTTALTLFGGLTLTQVYAQEEYKPLTIARNTLFTANKQEDPEPSIPLAPTEETEVANLEFCDMVLKYPKNNEERELIINFGLSPNNTTVEYGIDIMGKVPFEDDNIPGEFRYIRSQSRYLTIGCKGEAYSFPNHEIEETIVTPEQVREKHGWFFVEEINSPITQQVGTRKDGKQTTVYQFEHQGEKYFIIETIFIQSN